MKKTLFACIFGFSVSVALALGIAAADCTHNYRIDYTACVAATCEAAGKDVYVCSRCGETKEEKVDATGHDYVKKSGTDATCTEKGIVVEECSVCEKERTDEKEALGHDFKESTRKEATCKAAGSLTYKCSRCDEKKTETIEALDHDFTKFISSSATCTAAGKSTYQCSRCDELTLKSVTSLGHDYKKTGGPTCTESGRYVNTCTRCGHTKTDTKTTKALGHDLPADKSSLWRVTKKATCEEDGTRRAKCARCAEYVYEDIPALDHEFSMGLYLVKAPTKTTAGKAEQVCETCGYAKQKTIAKGTTNLSKYTVPPVYASHEDDMVARGTKITLECDFPDATIYYTTNGRGPSIVSARKEYRGPIEIVESTTIKAYAVYEADDSVNESEVLILTMLVSSDDPWLFLTEDAKDGGYMSLESGKKFRPDDNATRYEVLDAMDALFESFADDADIAFTDVDKAHADVVAKFVGAKLLDGYEDKTFRGKANITRAELSKLIVLALGMETSKKDVLPFKDVSLTHWAYTYIAALTKAGYLKGDTDGRFRPDDPITRAEVITLLNRVAGIKNSKGVEIKDVAATHWAYGYICAAVEIAK